MGDEAEGDTVQDREMPDREVQDLEDGASGRARPRGKDRKDLDRAPGPPSRKDDGPTVHEMIEGALAGHVAQFLGFISDVPLDRDTEDVHQARVAIRRIRSDLRTFGPLVDTPAVEPVIEELKWMGRSLGEVRDRDILLELLAGQVGGMSPEDMDGAAVFLDRLKLERDNAFVTMAETLAGERAKALEGTLRSLVATPPVLAICGPAPARPVVPALVNRPFRRLVKAVLALGDHPTDEALHDVRLLTKRCRYAAEAAELVVGKPATRLADDLARLQTILGNLQDSAVAQHWLREAAGTATPRQILSAGLLIKVQQDMAERSRREWKRAWRRAARRRNHSWLR